MIKPAIPPALKNRLPGRAAGLFLAAWCLALIGPPVTAKAQSLILETAPQGSPAGSSTEPRRKPAKNGLPDGRVAAATRNSDVVKAWYTAPTRRYRHGALGDVIEGGALTVLTASGGQLTYTLPEEAVFEDNTPRLADLNDDGRMEVVTILSLAHAGGSVAVFGLEDGKLVQKAVSKPIGRSNRWLNIAGIADFAGFGRLQIAYVETPHIGGTLKVLDWRGKDLKVIASMPGFSNHKIGDREQNLTTIWQFNRDDRPDLVVPANDHRTLRIIGFEGKQLKEYGRIALSEAISRSQAALTPNAACVSFELASGSAVRVCKAQN